MVMMMTLPVGAVVSSEHLADVSLLSREHLSPSANSPVTPRGSQAKKLFYSQSQLGFCHLQVTDHDRGYIMLTMGS